MSGEGPTAKHLCVPRIKTFLSQGQNCDIYVKRAKSDITENVILIKYHNY